MHFWRMQKSFAYENQMKEVNKLPSKRLSEITDTPRRKIGYSVDLSRFTAGREKKTRRGQVGSRRFDKGKPDELRRGDENRPICTGGWDSTEESLSCSGTLCR